MQTLSKLLSKHSRSIVIHDIADPRKKVFKSNPELSVNRIKPPTANRIAINTTTTYLPVKPLVNKLREDQIKGKMPVAYFKTKYVRYKPEISMHPEIRNKSHSKNLSNYMRQEYNNKEFQSNLQAGIIPKPPKGAIRFVKENTDMYKPKYIKSRVIGNTGAPQFINKILKGKRVNIYIPMQTITTTKIVPEYKYDPVMQNIRSTMKASKERDAILKQIQAKADNNIKLRKFNSEQDMSGQYFKLAMKTQGKRAIKLSATRDLPKVKQSKSKPQKLDIIQPSFIRGQIPLPKYDPSKLYKAKPLSIMQKIQRAIKNIINPKYRSEVDRKVINAFAKSIPTMSQPLTLYRTQKIYREIPASEVKQTLIQPKVEVRPEVNLLNISKQPFSPKYYRDLGQRIRAKELVNPFAITYGYSMKLAKPIVNTIVNSISNPLTKYMEIQGQHFIMNRFRGLAHRYVDYMIDHPNASNLFWDDNNLNYLVFGAQRYINNTLLSTANNILSAVTDYFTADVSPLRHDVNLQLGNRKLDTVDLSALLEQAITSRTPTNFVQSAENTMKSYANKTNKFIRKQYAAIRKVFRKTYNDILYYTKNPQRIVNDFMRVGGKYINNKLLPKLTSFAKKLPQAIHNIVKPKVKENIEFTSAQIKNQVFQNAGFSKFMWSTKHDNRVRPSHKLLDNKIFAFNNPPIINGRALLPGEDYNCRCIAIPVE